MRSREAFLNRNHGPGASKLIVLPLSCAYRGEQEEREAHRRVIHSTQHERNYWISFSCDSAFPVQTSLARFSEASARAIAAWARSSEASARARAASARVWASCFFFSASETGGFSSDGSRADSR